MFSSLKTSTDTSSEKKDTTSGQSCAQFLGVPTSSSPCSIHAESIWSQTASSSSCGIIKLVVVPCTSPHAHHAIIEIPQQPWVHRSFPQRTPINPRMVSYTPLGYTMLQPPPPTVAPLTNAISVPPPSVLRGKTIEEIVNKWTADLDSHVREFNKFAGEVAVWDRALMENGNNVSATLHPDVGDPSIGPS